MAKKKKSTQEPSPDLKKKLEELEDKVEEPTQITRIRRLKELQEKLEGTHRLEKLKKFKKKLFAYQLFGMAVLFPLIIYLNDPSLEPLYFPIYHSILMLFGWALILCIQHFIFRLIRIRRHRTFSTKTLIARKEVKKSIVTAIVVLLVFSTLYAPYLFDEMESRSSVEETIEIRSEGENIEFHSKGRLGLTILRNISVSSANDSTSLNVRIYEDGDDAPIYEEEGNSHEISKNNISANEFKIYTLNVSAQNAQENLEIEYNINMEMLERSQSSFSILAFVYLGVFSQAAAIFYPLRVKYKGGGVYG